MAEITLVIGAAAHGSDGFRGEVKHLVVDPAARAVTHLVIEPERELGTGYGLGRLVPLDHVDATGDELGLGYTEAEFMNLSPAEEALAEYVPVQLLVGGWQDTGLQVMDGSQINPVREVEEVDVVPEGEVEEGGLRHDRVHATDGDAGKLQALRVDPADGRITQVLFKRHGWSREQAISIDKVSGFDAGIQLNVAKHEL
jgi:hypothetical protein